MGNPDEAARAAWRRLTPEAKAVLEALVRMFGQLTGREFDDALTCAMRILGKAHLAQIAEQSARGRSKSD